MAKFQQSYLMVLQKPKRSVAPPSGPLRVALYTTSQASPRPPYPLVIKDYRVAYDRPLPIRTLYHRRFQEEDYLDLSDSCGVLANGDADISISSARDLSSPERDREHTSYIDYWRKSSLLQEHKRRELAYFPFPVNTRGFMYFQQHRYPIASSLRFRIAQTPNLDGYFSGQDLMTPLGTPWHIPLVALVASPRYASIVRVLQEDGYMPPQLYDCCKELNDSVARSSLGAFSQLLFKTWQPFYLDLKNPRHKMFLVSQNGISDIYLRDIFPEEVYPFRSGVLLCRFEQQRGQEQMHLALRVLRIVEPVQFAEGYEGSFETPQTGQCIKHLGKEHTFLSQSKAGQRQNLASRVMRAGKNGRWAYAWSWSSLKSVAGADWKFPWEQHKQLGDRRR